MRSANVMLMCACARSAQRHTPVHCQSIYSIRHDVQFYHSIGRNVVQHTHQSPAVRNNHHHSITPTEHTLCMHDGVCQWPNGLRSTLALCGKCIRGKPNYHTHSHSAAAQAAVETGSFSSRSLSSIIRRFGCSLAGARSRPSHRIEIES